MVLLPHQAFRRLHAHHFPKKSSHSSTAEQIILLVTKRQVRKKFSRSTSEWNVGNGRDSISLIEHEDMFACTEYYQTPCLMESHKVHPRKMSHSLLPELKVTHTGKAFPETGLLSLLPVIGPYTGCCNGIISIHHHCLCRMKRTDITGRRWLGGIEIPMIVFDGQSLGHGTIGTHPFIPGQNE